MKKQKFWRFLSLLLMGLSLFTSSMCDPDPEDPKLEVSTHEITLDAEGETQSFTIDSNVSWTITGNKSWLSVSPTMGKKDATVVLTAQQNTNVGNRDCLLTIMSADGGVSQTVKVVQDGAEGELRVNGSTSASLSFGADGGEKQQINITANSDWTITSIPDWIRVSPVNGSKNSTITDMYLNLTYTSSRWTVNTSRVGQYGQRCDEYYIFCVEGDYYASYYKDMVSKYTYALFAHLVFKPQIAEDPNDGYKYGPQDINYSRNSDQIFFACWGKDRDSKEFSAELTILHEDLSPDDDENTFVPQYSRVQNDNSSWNKPRRIIPRSEVEKLRKNMKVYKVQL